MLNNYNTMENANLLERKLLKKVSDLPIGTVIYALNNVNEVSLFVVNERCGDNVYLYSPSSYLEREFIVKADDEKLHFKDTDIEKARIFLENKTYNSVDIIDCECRYGDRCDLSILEPNTSRFYFNTCPVSTKSKKVEIKVEIKDTDYWVTRIPCDTYVLPAFNSDFSRYYPNVGRLQSQQIAKNIYSELKYRFKNPNEYEVCNYLIYSKDSHDKKFKTLEKLQRLPDNYNVVDIKYNKYSDEVNIKIDEIRLHLNAIVEIPDETIKLLDLQECRHCNCNTCKYSKKYYSSKEYQSERMCCKNVQMMQDNTPCHLYSPYSLYKVFNTEWNKATEEDKQRYLSFVKDYLYFDGHRVIIKKEDNVTYYTDNTDVVFERKPNEIIKADYKVTYYSRRKKNRRVVEKL